VMGLQAADSAPGPAPALEFLTAALQQAEPAAVQQHWLHHKGLHHMHDPIIGPSSSRSILSAGATTAGGPGSKRSFEGAAASAARRGRILKPLALQVVC